MKNRRDDERLVIILRSILERPGSTERELSEKTGIPSGKLNRLLPSFEDEGYIIRRQGDTIKTGFFITDKGKSFLSPYKVDCAVILAAGFGSRFVPLSFETPKGLLPVFGERMIERQICQLKEAGIIDIIVMVGYLKEKFDYLIDKYDVRLIYNPEYAEKGNLATLYHARNEIAGKNCYVLVSDNWIRENLYHSYEPHSWYASTFFEGRTKEWALRCGKHGRIKKITIGGEDSFCMYGPAYFSRSFSASFASLIEYYYHKPGTEKFYWEDALRENLSFLPPIYVNRQKNGVVLEFENLEELRLFDPSYKLHSGSRALHLISEIMDLPESDIVGISCLKAGMTNQSFLFSIRKDSRNEAFKGKSFICRIPGVGTGDFINRREEYEVYKTISPLGITEELIFFDPDKGYKLSRYYKDSRNADFSDPSDLKACMSMLKALHLSGVRLPHHFSIREQLRKYEALCLRGGQDIPFEDYENIKLSAIRVLSWLENIERPETVCHIDSVSDNFLFTGEGLKMIDWEYCGMADPIIDLAMAAIYSYMDFSESKRLLKIYRSVIPAFCVIDSKSKSSIEGVEGSDSIDSIEGVNGLEGIEGVNGPGNTEGLIRPESMEGADSEEEFEFKIMLAYMGLSGLLWALWSVYKMSLGESFGEYSLKMYRYFKDSYRLIGDVL